jgi:arsenate reductase
MINHKREILILYHPESRSQRKIVAYAKSLTPHVKAFPFANYNKSTLPWLRILQALNLPPKDLLDKSNPYYQLHIKGRDFDEDGWLKVLSRNPQLIKSAIAIRGNKAVLCRIPKDIFRLQAANLEIA